MLNPSRSGTMMFRYCSELSCASLAPCKEHCPGFHEARITDVSYLPGAPPPERPVDWHELLMRLTYDTWNPHTAPVRGRLTVGFMPEKALRILKAAAIIATIHPEISFKLNIGEVCEFRAGRISTPLKCPNNGDDMVEAFAAVRTEHMNAIDAVDAMVSAIVIVIQNRCRAAMKSLIPK